jgi:hypothetical protein
VQLDKATKQAGEASKLQDLVAALEETIQANAFLCRFDHLDTAISSLAKNRVSTAHAAQACAGMVDWMLKANTTIPNAAALQGVLEQPPAGAVPGARFFLCFWTLGKVEFIPKCVRFVCAARMSGCSRCNVRE